MTGWAPRCGWRAAHGKFVRDGAEYSLRKLVDRCINKLKNARRVATRYDKTAASYLGFIEIISVRLWFRHLST